MKRPNSGKKAKPTNLHILHGTYNVTRHGRDRAGEVQAKPFDFEQKPPKELSPAAKDHWLDVLSALKEANFLGKMDKDGLILYCNIWSRWVEANMNIETYGMIIRSPKDNKTPIMSPYFNASLKLGDQLRRLLSEYGMTPVSRVGIKKTPDKETPEDNSFAAWKQSLEH